METTTTRQRSVLMLDYDVNGVGALSRSSQTPCSTPASDPFSLLDRVKSAKQDEDIVIHVHGFTGSIAVAHLMTLWRECSNRGAHLRVVLLNHQSLQILKVLGLGEILDARLCPKNASNRVSWDPPSERTLRRNALDTRNCESCSNARPSKPLEMLCGVE
jgi:hypothetical protein